MTLQRHLNKSSHVHRAGEHTIMNKTVSFLKKKKNEEIEKKKDKHIVTYLPQSEDSP